MQLGSLAGAELSRGSGAQAPVGPLPGVGRVSVDRHPDPDSVRDHGGAVEDQRPAGLRRWSRGRGRPAGRLRRRR